MRCKNTQIPPSDKIFFYYNKNHILRFMEIEKD